MNFYISSRLNNRDQVRHMAGLLKSGGWTQTCDWTSFAIASENSPDSLQMIGEKEFAGVQAADILIALSPQGRGTHIELGMALALGKKVFIYHTDDAYMRCDEHTCAFYWLPQVTQLTGKMDTVAATILQAGTRPG